MSWAIHHSQSEELASQAEVTLKKGDRESARDLYRRAAEAEERALEALDPSKTSTLDVRFVNPVPVYFS